MAPHTDRSERLARLQELSVGEDDYYLSTIHAYFRSSVFRSEIDGIDFDGHIVFAPPPFADNKGPMEAAIKFLYTSNYKVPDSLFRTASSPFHAKVYMILGRFGVAHGKELALALFARALQVEHQQTFFTETIRAVFAWGNGELVTDLKNKIVEVCWENSRFLGVDKAFLELVHSMPAFGNAFIARLNEAANAYRDLLPEKTNRQ